MDKGGKLIVGMDRICEHYNITRHTFKWLLEQGAPIKKMGDLFFLHVESFERYMLDLSRAPQERPGDAIKAVPDASAVSPRKRKPDRKALLRPKRRKSTLQNKPGATI